MTDAAIQLKILKRGAVDIFPEKTFDQKVREAVKHNKPLNVKYGVDPTAPDIHLGFTVGLRKLRQFQDLGHQAVLLIGDYTATIGDPSGRDSTRPALAHDRILENAESYIDQACKILDREKLKVVYNGSWFAQMEFSSVMKLAASMTVSRMLEREDFKKRYTGQIPISLHEFFYPLMQGYDSVAIAADIELGGTDQRFNIAVGRDLQHAHGQKLQAALLTPILPGLDGTRKMSKSLGNYIGINDSPADMFGKLMSIPDKLMSTYFELLTDMDMTKVNNWLDGSRHPREVKKILAADIVSQYYDAKAAAEAAREFDAVFSNKKIPRQMPEIIINEKKLWIVELLSRTGHAGSNSELRRLIKAGAVSINGEKLKDDKAELEIKNDMYIKIGKKGFYRIKTPKAP
ncbi:MAG TPA: tyrosine--tRNA ligase [Spirochaetota bacterium]|nr:tyrosine--tRNA ligase [Spirochaetota bacterium]